MKYYSFFNIPNWEMYKQQLLDYHDNFLDQDYDLCEINPEVGNFMKILKKEKLINIVPDMVHYFDSLDLNISFLMILGLPYPVTDPCHELHKDYSPINDTFHMADYALNFSLRNTEMSHLLIFDENKNEVVRINYDHSPILFRTSDWHSIIDSSNKLRMTATIRFDKNSNLEKYLTDHEM